MQVRAEPLRQKDAVGGSMTFLQSGSEPAAEQRSFILFSLSEFSFIIIIFIISFFLVKVSVHSAAFLSKSKLINNTVVALFITH